MVLLFILASTGNAQPGNYCPLSPGFWKNHPADWPLGTMTLGDQSYTRFEALDLLNLPVTGDASVTLANQLVATLLNVANGSDLSPISSQISQSQTVLSGYAIRLPYGVGTSTSEGQAMIGLANQLDRYNSGRMTPHCVPPPVALPIQLASFTGNVVNSTTISLQWMTLSELNNYGFFVQRRRSDEPEFTTLANSFIPGHGTTVEPQYYGYTDNQVLPGSWYYRLQQIDLDGTIHLTDAILVDFVTGVGEETPKVFSLAQNYPNPFNPTTSIQFEIPAPSVVTLRVFNVLGQEVAVLVNGESRQPGSYNVQLDAGKLSSGVYFYELTAGSFHSLKRMLLLK